MSERTPSTPRPPKSRREMLARMQRVSNDFYRAATVSGVHAFIEFCGLMNEFIMMCRDADAEGVDFTRADTHSGTALPLRAFRAAYLAEKLKCIYGPALAEDEQARDTFVGVLFDGKYALAPVDGTTKSRSSDARGKTRRRVPVGANHPRAV